MINEYKGMKMLNRDKMRLVLFFVYPFGAFILALNSLKNKYSKVIIFLFFVLFGLTFIAQNKDADSYFYFQEFISYSNISTSQYLRHIRNYLSNESEIKDIYTISSYYLVSRLSTNYHILMALWAIVFSFFFLKSFHFFVKRPEFVKSLISAFLVFIFIFSNNIFNINGVRFYTAAWIAVYTIFEVIVNKNYRFIFLSFITPLVHISFINFVFVFLLYLIMVKKEKILVIVFIFSFFISEMSLGIIRDNAELFPEIIQHTIWDYAGESNFKSRIDYFEDLPFYAKILTKLPTYYINTLMFIFIYNSKKFNFNSTLHNVYLFLLVWLSFTNFTMIIPSLGIRFITISIPIISYLCLLTYNRISILSKLIYLIPIVYSYQILYWYRDMITVTDPYLILSVFPHLIIKSLI